MSTWIQAFATPRRRLMSIPITTFALALMTATAWAQQPEPSAPPTEAVEVQTEQTAPVEAAAEDQSAETGPTQDAAEATPQESAEPQEEEDEEEAGPDIGPALGLSVIGAASVVGGILYLVDAGDAEQDADAAQAAGQTDREEALRDRADRETALGIVLTSVGVAALGAATYFWITALTGQEEGEQAPETDVSLAPGLSPDGSALILLHGTF